MKTKLLATAAAFLLCIIQLAGQDTLQKRITGNPLDHLPNNITVLTEFGEWADFSAILIQAPYADN